MPTGTAMLGGQRMSAGQEMRVGDDPLIDALEAVAGALEDAGIPYAITGSIASSVHGEPFSSIDVDLMVLASAGQAAAIASRLAPRFYASVEALADAADRGGMANMVDNMTGMKVDLSFPGNDPFLRQTLGRRVKRRIGSHPCEFWFVTAEDVILMKLLWRKDTRSAKQWENALGVACVKGARMDWRYLFEQARTLGIENDLVALRDEAGI
jgi:hypothetical protein